MRTASGRSVHTSQGAGLGIVDAGAALFAADTALLAAPYPANTNATPASRAAPTSAASVVASGSARRSATSR